MKRYRQTSLITVACLGLLIGLALSRKLFIGLEWWMLAFAPALILVKKKNIISLILILVLFLAIGINRGDAYMYKLADINNLSGKQVTLQLNATNDAVYGNKSQIEFNANHIEISEPFKESLAGSAKISGFGVPMVYRGDRVEVIGKLFPMRGSNQIRIAYAQLRITEISNSPFAKLTRIFSSGIENALPEPQASFAMGLLVGQRTNLPPEIIQALTAVGLIHIVAVSGYNLTILTRASQKVRLRSKYQKALLSIVLIISFLLVTGFSASIVRAAIVSLLSLGAWFYGRTLRPILLLSFTAALTAFYNPFYLWSDIGWYLSFLAFFGVLLLAPLISSYIFTKPPQILTAVLIETLSAELMTLPLVMLVFGQMSIIAIVANLLIVPLVPAAMLLASLAAISGALIPDFTGWFSLPANILLTYILDVVHILSSIPKVVLHIKISNTLMISSYLIVLSGYFVFQKKHKDKSTIQQSS